MHVSVQRVSETVHGSELVRALDASLGLELLKAVSLRWVCREEPRQRPRAEVHPFEEVPDAQDVRS